MAKKYRKRFGWWLKGQRERVAVWLAPWLREAMERERRKWKVQQAHNREARRDNDDLRTELERERAGWKQHSDDCLDEIARVVAERDSWRSAFEAVKAELDTIRGERVCVTDDERSLAAEIRAHAAQLRTARWTEDADREDRWAACVQELEERCGRYDAEWATAQTQASELRARVELLEAERDEWKRAAEAGLPPGVVGYFKVDW